ncbi:MAG: hypothetical protein ACTSVI_05490 [Promethearchaeota archaeon]
MKQTFWIILSMLVGIISFILSYFVFNGLWSEVWTICGSPCEVWPGIDTGDFCTPVCIPRSGIYIIFFVAGFAFVSGIPFLLFVKRRKKLKR